MLPSINSLNLSKSLHPVVIMHKQAIKQLLLSSCDTKTVYQFVGMIVECNCGIHSWTYVKGRKVCLVQIAI